MPFVRAQTFQERVALCLACHGEKGQSQFENVPSLGAMPAPYSLIQLYLFREKQRRVEPMTEAAKGLTDDELRKLSDLIAKLPPPSPVADTPDAARIERARTLVRQHRCAFCHAPDFAGQESVPRLAAQREDYLIKSMREYKSNVRHGYDAAMAEVMRPIDDGAIRDLAYYLARVR
jgi:cytochrome c553